jgi:hypothetical protein
MLPIVVHARFGAVREGRLYTIPEQFGARWADATFDTSSD